MVEKAIGKRIQQYRKAKGLTQEQLAEKLDISTNHLSAIERGVYGVKLEMLVRIINLLGCSADDLLVDVVDAGYKTQASHLADKLEHISPSERKRILDVVETLLRHADK